MGVVALNTCKYLIRCLVHTYLNKAYLFFIDKISYLFYIG
jgi:hypothetical protein